LKNLNEWCNKLIDQLGQCSTCRFL
jgi:hypothetical protein